MLESLESVLSQRVGFGEFQLGLGDLLLAVFILVGGFLVARFVRTAFTRYAERQADGTKAAIYTVGRIASYTLVAVGAFVALSALGIPLSRFAVVLGALGVGLGFGLQAVFGNFVAGLILLFDRSLKVGDYVELASGVSGEVRDINIRATRIVTNDNIDILVPNSEFVTGNVVNWTFQDASRRLRIPFGVAYGSDKELVKKAALEAAEAVAFTLTQEGARAPQVWLVGFGDSSLDFELVVWLTAEATKRPLAVRAAYNWALETALCKHCVEIPFPQRDLHIRSVLDLAPEALLERLGGEATKPSEPREPRQPRQPPPRLDALTEAERAELARNDALADLELEIAGAPRSNPGDRA